MNSHSFIILLGLIVGISIRLDHLRLAIKENLRLFKNNLLADRGIGVLRGDLVLLVDNLHLGVGLVTFFRVVATQVLHLFLPISLHLHEVVLVIVYLDVSDTWLLLHDLVGSLWDVLFVDQFLGKHLLLAIQVSTVRPLHGLPVGSGTASISLLPLQLLLLDVPVGPRHLYHGLAGFKSP